MASHNYYVTNEDPEVLKTLKEEYESLGRDAKIEGNVLTVFALRQEKPKKVDKKVVRPRRDDQ